ncbi:hypothetical protein BHE74_00004920 [Ensete ventricosum]|nr:hypothetical protein BHE74_00004920 [Ensete ventricosum]
MQSGLPSFPFDFPDCKAYTSFMADEAAALDTASELRPLAVRPSRVPIPSPWNCIVSTVLKGPNILRGSLTMDAQTSSGIIPENSILNVDSKDEASLAECQAAVVFPEQNSGKWELQDCEDSLALQTFRWPIGFVTTGFVRGSFAGSACFQPGRRLLMPPGKGLDTFDRYLPDAAGDGASVAVNSAPVTPSGTETKAGLDVHLGNGGMDLRSLTGGSPEGIPFAVGDLVWGKTKNHPWWPALVSDPSRAPIDAKKAHPSDVSLLLVYCFGSGALAWCEPAQLKPFVEDFHRMARQSSSKSFVAAVEGALDEIRRRLQLELTCGCVPPETAGKTAECPAGRPPVSNFQPLEFLEHLQDVACDVTMADVLQVAALRSWVIAFGKGWTAGLPGYHPRREIMELVDKIDLDVPPGDLGDGNEDGDSECWITGSRVRKGLKTSADNSHKRQKKRSMAALIAGTELETVELSDGDEFTVEEKVKGVKSHMIKKDKDMDADGCGVEAHEDTGSGRRERKKSKYLSPPYTCLGAYTNTLDSPRSGEVKSPRKAAEASRALNSDISSLLRCDSEAIQKEEDTSNPGFGIESTSVNDILPELLCTARNPLHLKWNRSAKMIKSFFVKYRSSMYSSGSDFLTYQKHHNECCQVSIESPNKLIVNNSSELGKSEGGWKDKKDAADLEVETGLAPDSRSCSEQGKAGRKRKMRNNEDNNVAPADLEPRVINIPVERKNIKSKVVATGESVVLCPEPVNCMQPAEVGNKMNKKGKGVTDGQKAVEPGRDLSGCSQDGNSKRKRKKSKRADADVRLVDSIRGITNTLEKVKSEHTTNDDETCYPGALLLTFAPGVPLPSQSELISTFRKYGVVIESETELLKDTSSARVVFAKSTDAEKALNSSDKTGVFGPPFANYHLHYLPPIACSSHPMPPLPYIRESLERMISTLTTTTSVKETGPSDGMKPAARENLVGDMEGLLKKVKTMLNGAAAGT